MPSALPNATRTRTRHTDMFSSIQKCGANRHSLMSEKCLLEVGNVRSTCAKVPHFRAPKNGSQHVLSWWHLRRYIYGLLIVITNIFNLGKSTPTKCRVVMWYWHIELNSNFYTELLKKNNNNNKVQRFSGDIFWAKF